MPFRFLKAHLLLVAFTVLLAGCSGSPLSIPPTPTTNPALGGPVINHQHGESSIGGMNARLITKYGGPVSVSLATQPEKPRPGVPLTVTYSMKDKAGAPLEPAKLLVTHEKLMHLIVVSRDLKEFAHIHPEPQGDGRYSVAGTLPVSGDYMLFNEFVTAEGVTQIERNEVTTEGASPLPDSAAPLVPDLGTRQEVDGLTVYMTSTRKIRRRVPSTFTLAVWKDGKPATSLEPYLGAVCHVVLVSADTKQFAHTHGDVPGGSMAGSMQNMNMAMPMPTPPAHFGPRMAFTHTFMQPGVYRVWIQFGYAGKVVTVPYNVQVDG